ncbi:MAG TPA: HAD family acid phosphatase [Gemmatimonadota bacterium]|nr:HAD family acid phosphatase [Gemmatimonadota bacterium]
MDSRVGLLAAFAFLFASFACATSRVEPRTDPAPRPDPADSAAPSELAGHPTLFATLWQQTSAEYRASALQAYDAAREDLPIALADSGWTAAVEQEGHDFSTLPPAVVLDVDETVLDNSPQQARTILAGRSFDPEAWGAWVDEARAPAVPGARDFLALADSLGVAVFYVTNRDHPLEESTRRNLEAEGLPLDPELDTVLSRGEREGWGSDKASRRAAVAERYRILLLVGDDFNDFVSARLPREERDRLLERYRDRWGDRWFMIPNPVYGSWENALYGEADDTPEERARRQLESLEDFQP